MRRLPPLLLLLAVATPLASAPLPFPKRLPPGDSLTGKDLAGTWRIASVHRTEGGGRLKLVDSENKVITIGPTRWVFDGGRVGYDLRIDCGKKPAEFDLAYAGQEEPHFRGIIERRDDTVRVIYSVGKRPTGFDGQHPNCHLLTLKRR